MRSFETEMIYVDEEEMPADNALSYLTDEYIEGGHLCHQTIIDLRDYALVLLERIERLEQYR